MDLLIYIRILNNHVLIRTSSYWQTFQWWRKKTELVILFPQQASLSFWKVHGVQDTNCDSKMLTWFKRLLTEICKTSYYKNETRHFQQLCAKLKETLLHKADSQTLGDFRKKWNSGGITQFLFPTLLTEEIHQLNLAQKSLITIKCITWLNILKRKSARIHYSNIFTYTDIKMQCQEST